MSSSRSFVVLIIGININDLRRSFAESSRDARNAREAQETPSLAQVQSVIEYAKYAQIPETFTSAETFPRETNLLCWHCALSFNSVPRFIALDYKRVIGADGCEAREWTIEGNFCSWACASAYIETHYHSTKKWSLQQNLALIRAQIDHCAILPVRAAPSRAIMRAYCGSRGMAQQEFERTVAELSLAVPAQTTVESS